MKPLNPTDPVESKPPEVVTVETFGGPSVSTVTGGVGVIFCAALNAV